LQLIESLTNDNFSDSKSAIAHCEKQMFARFDEVEKRNDGQYWLDPLPDRLKTLIEFLIITPNKIDYYFFTIFRKTLNQ
jgi:hypothetical protein